MKNIKWTFIFIIMIFVLFTAGDIFAVAGYRINISITGNGSVSKNPDATYYENVNVTLTAVPDKGWKFVRWEGDLTGSNNPETIYVGTEEKYVTAVFEKIQNTATNLLILDNE